MNTKELEALQLNENKLMCDALKASAVECDVPHKIVHKLEFISEYKRADLIVVLEDDGFTMKDNFVTQEGYNGFTFEREDKVCIEEIDRITLYLLALLDEYDARYGGWIVEPVDS